MSDQHWWTGPVTAQPDFNTVTIEYAPDKVCVESKSLKLYLWTFREDQIFGEGLGAGVFHGCVRFHSQRTHNDLLFLLFC